MEKLPKLKGNKTDIIEVLEETKLNFIAEPREIFTSDGVTIPDNRAIVRNDNNKSLGIVGNRYQIIQNSDAFTIMDNLIKETGGEYISGGFTGKGSRVCLQAQLGESFNINGDNGHEFRINCVNSFDGTSNLQIYFMVYRQICTNGMMGWAKDQNHSVSIRHSKSADFRLGEASRILGIAKDYIINFKQNAEILAQKMVDRNMVKKFLNEVLGNPNKENKTSGELKLSTRLNNQHQKVISLFENGTGNNGKTAYDLVNGVTEFVDHNKTGSIDSMLFGTGAQLKEKAFEVALAL